MDSSGLAKLSYSQFGEDRVISAVFAYLFNYENIENLSYIDIGSNRPIIDNNTYFLYKNGGHGVLIDPNPIFKEISLKERPNDIFLNCGLTFDNRIYADYYSFEIDGWNTFSKERADFIIQNHPECKLLEIKKLPLININFVIDKYFNNRQIDLMSIDIEGMEMDILKSINYDLISKPKIICVEANKCDISYRCHHELIEFLESKNYALVADTFINFIFADIDKINTKFNKLLYNGRNLK